MYSYLQSKFTAHDQHWLIYAQVVGSLLSLIQLLILTRTLTPDIFGQYRYGIALTMIIPQFFLSGISNAITSVTAKTGQDIFFAAIKRYLQSTKLPTIIFLVISLTLIFFNFTFLGITLLIISLLSPLYQTTQLYSSYLNGKQDYKRIFLYGIIPDVISVLSVIAVSIFYREHPLIILTVFLLANTFASLIPFLLTVRIYKLRWVENTAPNDLALLSKTVSQSNLIQGIGGQIDKLISFHLVSSSGLAVYSIVIMVAQQFRGFQKILYSILLPKQSINRDHTQFYKALWLYIGASGLFCVAYIVAAPIIFTVLFPQYLAFVHLSQFASTAIIFTPLTFFTLSTLHGRHDKKRILQYTILTSALSTVLVLIGSIEGGTPGTVFAFVVSSIVSGILGFLFLKPRSF
jgi:O-antigen/teichoic acid export membrane protein